MKTVGDLIDHARGELGQLEKAMRGAIVNQNISDIVASARAKLLQASAHPDAATELAVLEPKDPDQAPLPFTPKFPGDAGKQD